MPKPDFTREELALLAQLEQPERAHLAFALAYLLPSGLLIAFGFVTREMALFAAAFAVIATFTIWQLRYQTAGSATLRRILHKYRDALETQQMPQ